MPLTMEARKEVTEQLCTKYRKATKKQKGVILDQITELTGWCRKHAAAVLSGSAPIPKSRKRNKKKPPGTDGRGRKPKYGTEHKTILKKVWSVLDFASSTRVKAGMEDVLDSLMRFGHITIDDRLYKDMLSISASTIDRMLKFDRQSMLPYGKTLTKPGTLLKSQIPVRRGSDWSEDEVGFVEIDLVAHCGNSAKGEFICTLDMTDVKSAWTELRAVRNKARVHTLEAIKYLRSRLPFDLLGIDSDNGSEFINDHLLTYCKEEDLVFTRGRPNTKNDGCFVEEKNWSIVRRFSGYYRFEGQECVDILNMMYDLLALYINYFMPSQKLISKTRDGGHVSRKHDDGMTPYRRIMTDKTILDETKAKLTEVFDSLDVYQLRHEIARLQDVLKRKAVPNG